MKSILCGFVALLCGVQMLFAHEVRPGFLKIEQTDSTHYTVVWKVPVIGEKMPTLQPIFPKGFELALLNENLVSESFIRRYTATYTGDLAGQEIRIGKIEKTLIDVLVQVDLEDNISHSFLLQAANPSVRIPLKPSIWEVVQLYVFMGIEHILLGIDHLLFVLGLVFLVKHKLNLVKTITAFTIAHSLSLAAATLGWVHIPQKPVEAVIALSIVFLAREALVHSNKTPSLTSQYPWSIAFAFGLLHGLAFASALAEIGLPQTHLPLALFTFNIGVEIGQLAFILAVFFLYFAIEKLSKNWLSPQRQKIILYSMGGLAMFWFLERMLLFF